MSGCLLGYFDVPIPSYERELFLGELSAIRGLYDDTWFVGRDFNVVRFSKKWGNCLSFSAYILIVSSKDAWVIDIWDYSSSDPRFIR